MKVYISVEILGETPAKKNSRITLPNGKTIPSKRYRDWRGSALPQVFRQIGGPRPAINEPCEVAMEFVHGDRRRRDCDNGASSVLDLLVDAGVLADDNWEIVRSLKVSNAYEKGNPRVAVRIDAL